MNHPPLAVPRLPKNYRALLDILEAAGHGKHFSTTELFEAAKERLPGIGFTTVYRGLQRLRALALVDEIEIPGADAAVYEVASTEHAHFRCDRCGTVVDVPFELPPDALAAFAKSEGARVTGAKITLHGSCANCLAI